MCNFPPGPGFMCYLAFLSCRFQYTFFVLLLSIFDYSKMSKNGGKTGLYWVDTRKGKKEKVSKQWKQETQVKRR